jgi:hypothetical protein
MDRRWSAVQQRRASDCIRVLLGSVGRLPCANTIGSGSRSFRRDTILSNNHVVCLRSDLASTHRDRHASCARLRPARRASLFQLVDSTKQHDQLQRAVDGVRDRVGKNISALRTISEAVEYKFGVDRWQHVRSSELILQISPTATALIWNQVALLHGKQKLDFLAEPGLVEMRRNLADRLDILAEAVVRKAALPAEHLESFVSRNLLESDHYGEYARNTIARYENLQTLAAQLGGEV